jgi:hypothetical protein
MGDNAPHASIPNAYELSVIRQDAPPHDPNDERFQEEKRELDLEAQRTGIIGARSDIEAKRTAAKRTFWMVASWIVAVFVLLLLQGFGYRGFHLSDNVLLAAIGSTTANVIGMLLIVLRHLFPSKGKE